MRLHVVMFGWLALTGGSVAQDLEAGQKVFNRCRGCHQVGEGAKNTIGPNLNGLFGRKAGAVADYAYSDANRASGLTWDHAAFADYIQDPRARMPGTKMSFAGLKDQKDVADLTAYLSQFNATGGKAP